MDQREYQNLQSLTSQLITSQFRLKVAQLLIPVSLFLFILFYSSWYSFLLHFLNFQSSTFSLQLLGHTINKKCIFFICNGILVFLATTSGFVASSSHPSDLSEQFFKKNGDGIGSESVLGTKELLLEKEASSEEEEDSIEGESEDSSKFGEDEKRETPNGVLNRAGGGEGEGGGIETVEEDDNEKDLNTLLEEEEERLLSTEELNKKFDEFIRRMKEEIRVGAQLHQVMA